MSDYSVARLEEIEEITDGRRARARTRAFPRMRLTTRVDIDRDGNEGH
jgi:hypothetical protein